MLAEPEGIESQFLGPFSHSQNFLVVLLVGPTDLGGIFAEYKKAKILKKSFFFPGGLLLAITLKPLRALDDRSYPKTREISTWTTSSNPSGLVTGLGKHRLHSEERLQLKCQGVYSPSRSQIWLRPNKEKPINPRTSSFWLLSMSFIRAR